jgi:hypothetical protein
VSVKLVTQYLNDGIALGDMVRALPEMAVDEEDVRRISVPMCSRRGWLGRGRRVGAGLTRAALLPEEGGIPVAVSGDPDGIRTHDLQLDKLAC